MFTRKLNKSAVIHPFLFAVFPIFFLFSNNVNSVYPDKIIFPLLLVIFVTFMVWITLSVVLKSRIKSGFITTLGLVIFFSYGHIYILLDEIQKDVHLSQLFLLIPSLSLFGLGSYYFIKTKKPLNNATMIVNVVAISLIMISFVNVGEYYITENYFLNNLSEGSEENLIQLANAESFPDIYYIILDGYPGSKSLQVNLNFDNSEFIDFLTNNGFYVSQESYSNYQQTMLSIPSTLNLKYLNYLAEEKGTDSKDEKVLIQMARDNKVIQYLKSRGYTIFAIESGSIHTQAMKNVDFHLCGPSKYFTSEFDNMLVRTTMLNLIHVQLFTGDHRGKILCGFSELAKMSERNDNPKFVLAHLMIPHRPLIFGPNGEDVNPEFISWDDPVGTWDTDRYLGQLKFANKKIKDVVEKLTKSNPSPIIIIQSDHGMRTGDYDNDAEKLLRTFNNFKAYHFPEKGRSMEFETTTSVNSFRVLFNLYFDENYKLLEDKIYFSPEEKPYEFTDVTDILIKK